jgi:G3E family GTPase
VTPTNVITGFLGVGKTTAILDAFHRLRPEHERWAVLVNEFGVVGIDGAILGDLPVREVRGGCICCTSGPQLRASLVRLLREERPDRLLIEPSGLAHPATILDMLRSVGIRESVSVRAIVTLLDLRRMRDARLRASDVYTDQIAVADVLVGNRLNDATPDDLEAFQQLAGSLWPPKRLVTAVAASQLELAWLDLHPSSAITVPIREASATTSVVVSGGVLRGRVDGDFSACGWIFPSDRVFDRDRLLRVVQGLARPSDVLAHGMLRAKGIFRFPQGWLQVHAEPDRVQMSGTGHRADSRFELIVPSPAPDWDAVERLLLSAAIDAQSASGG